MPSKPTPRFNPRGGDRRGQRQLPTRGATALWYGLAFLLVLGLAQMFYFAPAGKNIPYSEFKTLVKNGQVTEATIGDQTIHGKLKDDATPFTVTRVDDPKLV